MTDPYGVLQVLTTEEYRLASAKQINQLLALSVAIAVLGAATGIILGVWLGWCFVRVLAAFWPARQAAATHPLAAVG